MSLSNQQKALLKRLQRQAGLPDADYRELFAEVTGWADCRSSTDARLTQAHMDALKARLLARARPGDLNAQLVQQAQPRRRREHRIAEIQQCLALYRRDVAGYVAHVIAIHRKVPADGALTFDDLSDEPEVRTRRDGTPYETTSELERVLMTLWSRLQPMRRQAGHSLHDMRTKAGVPCACAKICRWRTEPPEGGKSDQTARHVDGQTAPAAGMMTCEENPF